MAAVLPTDVQRVGETPRGDQGHRGEAVEEAELAQGIDDVDLGLRARRGAGGAPGDAQPGRRQRCRHLGAARGMARGDEGQEPGPALGEAGVEAARRGLLAGVGAGGEPARPLAERRLQRLELGRVSGQRRGRLLEVAEAFDGGGAQGLEALGLGPGLGQAEGEAREHGADQPRRQPPAGKRARRHAPLQQRHGQPLMK